MKNIKLLDKSTNYAIFLGPRIYKSPLKNLLNKAKTSSLPRFFFASHVAFASSKPSDLEDGWTLYHSRNDKPTKKGVLLLDYQRLDQYIKYTIDSFEWMFAAEMPDSHWPAFLSSGVRPSIYSYLDITKGVLKELFNIAGSRKRAFERESQLLDGLYRSPIDRASCSTFISQMYSHSIQARANAKGFDPFFDFTYYPFPFRPEEILPIDIWRATQSVNNGYKVYLFNNTRFSNPIERHLGKVT